MCMSPHSHLALGSSPDPAVADPAVDLVVGPVADRGRVDGLVAERAAEAVAVVPAGRRHHLLRLEHLSVAPNRIFLFIRLVVHARSESILYRAGLEGRPQFATIFRQIEAEVVSNKVDFGYSTSRKLVVEDVLNSGQKMAEEALIPMK